MEFFKSVECAVCSEDVHRVLSCGCGFSACEECFKKWFISDPNEARCMSCKRALTLSWMLKNITTHWVNDTKKGYRSHLKETLLDKQTSLLQDTAGAVERYKAREALVESNERKRRRRVEVINTLKKLKHQKNELESKCCVKFRKGRNIPFKSDYKYFCKLCYVELKLDPDVKKYRSAKTKFMKGYRETLRTKLTTPTEFRKLQFKKQIVCIKARHFCCEELRTLAVAIATCNNKLRRKHYNPKRLPFFRLGDDNANTNTPQEEEKKEFIGGCPYKGCNGLVEARKFKCIVCEKRVCKMCLKPRKRKTELKPNERPHVCNKDDIASVKLIRNDTKQCPKCFVGIHKYEGCRTMFCTMCKTSFDYYTGEIINRDRTNAHNPHLIEWLRENGNLPTAPEAIIQCGVLPDPSLFEAYWWSALNLYPIYQSVGHTHTFEDHIQEKYQQLRVDYILGKITKAKWKQSIFIHHRMIDRATIKNHILETFRHAAIERFVVLAEKIRDKTVTKDTTDDFILEMNALRELTNKNMRNELVFYGATVYYYCDASWKWCKKKM